MTVEIYLRKPEEPTSKECDKADQLPNTLIELEVAYKELEWSSQKLRESTDHLIEEFDKSGGEEAKEYYEYIQDNFEILKQKTSKMAKLKQKMNQMKGVFDIDSMRTESTGSGGAGGLFDEGHSL